MKRATLKKALHSYTECRSLLAKDPKAIEEVVKAFLENIEAQQDLNAFVEVYKEEAQISAQALAQQYPAKAKELQGMVVGIKDLFCYGEHHVEAASQILKGFKSHITATPVARLQEAGAILIGRQNCDEFGMGSSNENSIHGWAKNPIDKERSPGGSSGGSAAAVRAGMCHVSLGTDTGGSCLQPAAFCGVIGLRPTYARSSRWGMIAHSSSFDTPGLIFNEVADGAAALKAISGKDEKDNTSSSHPVPDYPNLCGWDATKKCKIAYFREALDNPGIQPEVKEATLNLLERLKAAGHEVKALDFPMLAYAVPTYYVLTSAEATANLARYDGVRYGFRAEGKTFEEMITKTRTLGFGDEVKRRLILGTFALSSNQHNHETIYQRAQKVRLLKRNAMQKILADHDYIISPTTPTTAFLSGKTKQNPATAYLADLYTVTPAIVGMPAISIPNGTDTKGLPIGALIMTRPFQEQKLFSLAEYLLNKWQ
ncbi:MAG: amidase family protein [Cytophagales bacterium]